MLDLIRELESLNVRLWCDGDALKYEAPSGVMTPQLASRLQQHKHDLLAHFCAGNLPPRLRRAITALDYLMNQKRRNLQSKGYSISSAMVKREEWRNEVMRILSLHWRDMDALENQLHSMGALGYEQDRIYVVRC